ncbi:unnamed protein product, partial [Effrenium voratum]
MDVNAGVDQQCPVCWSLLCEPVAWPDCAHHFCLICALRTRRRPKPVCPLCRAPAGQVRQASELQVSTIHASSVRKVVGYSAYEFQRRETWAQAAELDAAGGLGGPLPLVAGHGEVWQRLRLGSQQEVLMGSKYDELLQWSRSKGGCFAVVLQPTDFEVGAKGRVCRVVDFEVSPSPERRVLVEAGAACRIIELKSEAEPFFLGKLEELDEDELPAVRADGPLAAAADMVNILGVLGRNLQAVRQRWMMTALVSLLDEDNGESLHADRQGLESMLGVMMSYRQIIHQMDTLLSQASATADRLLPLADEREDEPDEEMPEPPDTPAAVTQRSSSSRSARSQASPREVGPREPAVSQVEALRRRG